LTGRDWTDADDRPEGREGPLMELARAARLLSPNASVTDLRRRVEHYAGRVRELFAYSPPAYRQPLLSLRATEHAPRHLRVFPAASQPDFGWGRHAERLTVGALGGSHHTIMNRPHVGQVADCLL